MMHWDPFAELNRIQQLSRRNENAERAMRPLVDIREDETSFVVQAELPGTKPEDVHVEVERGVLTIRGERRFSSDENVQKQYRRVERYYGAFERSFSLPSEVDGLKGRPEAENLVGIYAGLAGVSKEDVLRDFGGAQFSTFKPELINVAVAKMAPVADEMRRILADPAYVDGVLRDGGERAGRIAEATMRDVRSIIGLLQG